MGDRSHIVIRTSNPADTITLYGHWSGTDNLEAVKRVLAKTGRIGDASYLTAELFYEFAVMCGKYAGVGSNGFGIWAGDDGGSWEDNPTIYVNAEDGTYEYDGVPEDLEDEPIPHRADCPCFECQKKAVLDQSIIHT